MTSPILLPAGFDKASVKGGDGVRDRYQLGAAVFSAVSCGWVHGWDDAIKAGDDAATQRAVEAMATSRDWLALNDMNVNGDYPEMVWLIADAMAGRDTYLKKQSGVSTHDAIVAGANGGLGCDR